MLKSASFWQEAKLSSPPRCDDCEALVYHAHHVCRKCRRRWCNECWRTAQSPVRWTICTGCAELDIRIVKEMIK